MDPYHNMRPLEVNKNILSEYKEKCKEGRTYKSKLAEHVRDKQHKVNWEDPDIVVIKKPVLEKIN